ncbi:MAG: helix-turn-helix transcriptional regulator [Clostridia bacterium]|nr:helix-turn-helix transcriptional regulator [Clostridia bacterium]
MVIIIGMNNVMEIFAKRLKELRKDKGLSITELAKELGLSYNAIRRWELQMQIPNIEMLNLVAKYFNETPNYLLGYED